MQPLDVRNEVEMYAIDAHHNYRPKINDANPLHLGAVEMKENKRWEWMNGFTIISLHKYWSNPGLTLHSFELRRQIPIQL